MDLFYAPDFPQVSELPQGEAKHAVRVLRKVPGDLIHVTDGKGNIHTCEVISTTGQSCTVRSIKVEPARQPCQSHLHIAIAPVKNFKRFEWFLEKVTEIGINEITPVIAFHSERKSVKKDRAAKVLANAMKQSLKGYLPILNEPTAITEFLAAPPPSEQRFVAHLSAGAKPIAGQYRPGRSVLVLIGPEGDFSEDELNIATGNGFVPITLGQHRLRTETAGVVACAAIHAINDMT